MPTVNIFDKRIISSYSWALGTASTLLSITLVFIEVPTEFRLPSLSAILIILLFTHLTIWARATALEKVELEINGNTVIIKSGDIFKEPGLKTIPFNEYFDTQVDNKIIAEASLNGIFINRHLPKPKKQLDAFIDEHLLTVCETTETNEKRAYGKKKKYKLGTTFCIDDYIFTSLTKFDEEDKANLTIPEYIEFLTRFWESLDKIYAQQSVSIPIFGSGITRFKSATAITESDLLKLILLTFRISGIKFTHPSKLSIIIHKEKVKKINLFEIKNSHLN